MVAAAGPSSFLAPHRDGPPPAHTGGFGEPTCQECHVDAGLNEPGGWVAIAGAPNAYTPGSSYDLIVTVERAGIRRAGFQLAARFADGAAVGLQAGVLTPLDSGSAVVWDSVRRVGFLQHAAAGTNVTEAARRWSFRWTAPPSGHGVVLMHVAGNAVNDDNSPFGDFVYTKAIRIPASRRRSRPTSRHGLPQKRRAPLDSSASP